MMMHKTQALAYRIWAYAQPLEWNCTMQEVATALDESLMRVSAVCRSTGWHNRMRTDKTGRHDANYVSSSARKDEVALLAEQHLRASNLNQNKSEDME